jgi:hypothetical protein
MKGISNDVASGIAYCVAVASAPRLDRGILLIRGQRVMLDADLAALFGVSTRALNQAIKRNLDRFPADFLFRLNPEEKAEVVTICDHLSGLKFSRHLPYALTEHGAVMAATVLNSKRAAEVSVFVVRAFVRMRQLLASHHELALKLTDLERRVAAHDTSISSLVSAIRQLLQPPEPKKKRIGFVTDDDRPGQTGSGSDFLARDRSRRRTLR